MVSLMETYWTTLSLENAQILTCLALILASRGAQRSLTSAGVIRAPQ